MTPTLILDTSVLIAGLRSSLGASFALLNLVGSGIEVITPGEALRRLGVEQ